MVHAEWDKETASESREYSPRDSEGPSTRFHERGPYCAVHRESQCRQTHPSRQIEERFEETRPIVAPRQPVYPNEFAHRRQSADPDRSFHRDWPQKHPRALDNRPTIWYRYCWNRRERHHNRVVYIVQQVEEKFDWRRYKISRHWDGRKFLRAAFY